MITHYLKVAVRNLLKYKTQSVISIMGLAVGFVCFALSTLWIRYEMTYDAFHEDAENIQLVRIEDPTSSNGLNPFTPGPLSKYLKKNFAEVKDDCNLDFWNETYKIDGQEIKLNTLAADSATLNFFGIQLMEGSYDFLTSGSNNIAITHRCAQRLFGNENPIGKEIATYYQTKLTICAIVSEWSEHSNLNYDFIKGYNYSEEWNVSSGKTFIRLSTQTNQKEFAKKLYNHSINRDKLKFTKFVLTPITSIRYDRPEEEAKVKLSYVVLFALASALVVLCSLLNYLTLFISHIRLRSKELALRMVNGSSNLSMFVLLASEYILLLLSSLLVGMLFIELLLPQFKELAEIKMNTSSIYLETAAYCLGIIILSMLISAIPILYYHRKSVQSIISFQKNGRNRNLFRELSVGIQLVISLLFIFCTLLMIKQVHFLTNTDIGLNKENTAAVVFNYKPHVSEVLAQLQTIPEIETILEGHKPLIPFRPFFRMNFEDWEEKAEQSEPIMLETNIADSTYSNFYGLNILEGEMINPSSPGNSIVLNETAAKTFGWDKPIGKYILTGDSKKMYVTGIMKDYHVDGPTIPVKPTAFIKHFDLGFTISGIFDNVLFKYKEGTWPTCKTKIEKILSDFPESRVNLYNSKEEYAKFLNSENTLLKLLGTLSLVCVLISIFAIYSLVALTCEQRRKEIAIRKVNGAQLKDILSIFIKEYIGLLCIASAIAFPIGYVIMKHWLENYTQQTEISWWLFVCIFICIAIVIILSIGHRVWRSANENPADVVKSE